MHSFAFLSTMGAIALVRAQSGAPPPPVVLSTTKSGVLPIIPTATPFAGVDTLEGAIINPGPVNPGFVGPGGTATAQSNLPAATYRAELPDTMFDPLVGTVIKGSITAVGGDSGTTFSIDLTDLPDQAQYGPFPYHIHNLPVPADGNCTATLGHFDPTNRGELYMCDATAPETCQVGDLAGKHGGKIATPDSFQTTFTDAYLSTDPSSSQFFGGLSIVIHSSNTTRLTCANFQLVGGQGNGTSPGNATQTYMPSGTGAPSGTASGLPVYTGAASKAAAAVGVVAAGFFGLML